jgi:hypothetical protein
MDQRINAESSCNCGYMISKKSAACTYSSRSERRCQEQQKTLVPALHFATQIGPEFGSKPMHFSKEENHEESEFGAGHNWSLSVRAAEQWRWTRY